MKRLYYTLFWLKAIILFSAICKTAPDRSLVLPPLTQDTEVLKKEALEVLVTQCNVCHRKKNPFMVFKAKNMSKRAERIYRAVFVEKRMPKGTENRLTEVESQKLKNWLVSENIEVE